MRVSAICLATLSLIILAVAPIVQAGDDFEGKDLKSQNFSNKNLTEANFADTTLTPSFKGAMYDGKTIFPKGIEPDTAGAVLVAGEDK